MRLVTRNTVPVWYALYESEEFVTYEDEYGNVLKTGEHKATYGEPQQIKASVSPARGEAQADVFGTDISYSKVMIVSDKDCPINENSILWLTEPAYDDDGNPVYEYTVSAVVRSLNYTSYAIRKCEVS